MGAMPRLSPRHSDTPVSAECPTARDAALGGELSARPQVRDSVTPCSPRSQQTGCHGGEPPQSDKMTAGTDSHKPPAGALVPHLVEARRCSANPAPSRLAVRMPATRHQQQPCPLSDRTVARHRAGAAKPTTYSHRLARQIKKRARLAPGPRWTPCVRPLYGPVHR